MEESVEGSLDVISGAKNAQRRTERPEQSPQNACLPGKPNKLCPTMFFCEGFGFDRASGVGVQSLIRLTHLLPACFAMFLASSASGAPPPCPPTRAGGHVATLPQAWRSAVESLLVSTTSPELPWGCVGGKVDLVVEGSSGTLTVVDAQGNAVSRDVSSPEDVVPLGEALLAKPLAAVESSPPESSPSDISPEIGTPNPRVAIEQPTQAAPLPKNPRLLVAATGGPRYAGPGEFLMASLNVQALVPFRPWAGGIWIRVDGLSRALDRPVPPTRELSLGAVAAWSMNLGRLELRPTLKPSLAIVTRELRLNKPPPDFPQDPMGALIVKDTSFDFRFGADLQFALSLTKHLRGIASVDAEISPEQMMTRSEVDRSGQPAMHLPSMTAGIGLGLEVVVP